MTEIVKNAATGFSSIDRIIEILPEQGCVEIQRDASNKVHDWHRHPNAETLIVLKGEMMFSLEGGDHRCGPGDVLRLSADALHKSTAGSQGAIYIVAFRDLPIGAG